MRYALPWLSSWLDHVDSLYCEELVCGHTRNRGAVHVSPHFSSHKDYCTITTGCSAHVTRDTPRSCSVQFSLAGGL
jgi:hypothetical protein